MEINPYLPISAAGRTLPSKSAASPAKTSASDAAQFEETAVLENALQNVPDVRHDKVVQGKELVSNVDYPPPETIRKISHLLALKIDSPDK